MRVRVCARALYRILPKPVFLTVENGVGLGYNTSMERTNLQLGTLGVSDAVSVLLAGIPVYVASAVEPTDELKLRGGWVDDDGNLHYDWAGFYLCKDTALQVGRANAQQCILSLTPNAIGTGRVYLLKDTPRNRNIALKYCGGYTADGKCLITATNKDIPLTLLGKVLNTVSVDIDFPPCE